MKLRQLHINSFGHFVDCDIQFPSNGLQVIYGPNEAGKTTLLEFLRGWLFDFPVQTAYDFKSGTEMSGVGTLALSDGRLVELRRRKGNKDKVQIKVDGVTTDLNEVDFQHMVGHANKSLFESIFAFGLDQLSRGKESLKHESLQSALFSGGLGTAASPERILSDLENRAREIFDSNPRKNTTIKAILAQIKELTAQIKQKSLRSDEYQTLRQAAADSRVSAAEIHEQLNQMRSEQHRTDKLLRAHQKWAELQRHKLERQTLSVPKTLPSDAAARFASLKLTLQSGRDEAERLAGIIGSLERELQSLRLDPGCISFRAEIRSSLELRQSYLEAKRDLPRLKTDHAATRQQIDRELSELRPGWKHDDLAGFSIDVATRNEIDHLVEEDRDRTKSETELRAKRQQLSSQFEQSQADFQSLGEPQDASSLAAILVEESAYESDRKELEKRTTEASRISRQLTTRLKKLTPSLPDLANATSELAIPRIESVNIFEVDFNEANESLRTTLDSIEEDERQLGNLKESLNATGLSGAIPTLEERNEARRRRDTHWETIRQQLLETKPKGTASDPQLLGDAFEQSIRDADRLADQIYANADAVARREELIRQCELLTKRLAAKQARVTELQAHTIELRTQWRTLWSPCGIEPLAPDVMRRWIGDYEAACDSMTKRDDNLLEISHFQKRIDAFEKRIRVASNSPDGDVAVLLSAAHQVVDDAREYQRRVRELHRDIKRFQVQLEGCDRDLTSLESRRSIWRDEWRSVLARLRLPEDWHTELTRTVIERLSATRVKLDSLPQEESRLAAMQARLDEFEARIRPLCEALSPDLLREPPELVAKKLSDQLELAIEAQKQHDQLSRQLNSSKEQLLQARDRLSRLENERAELFAAAEAVSEGEFADVVHRAETIRQLDTEIQRLSIDLDHIRAGEEREEFERSLIALEPASLEIRRVELDEQIEVTVRQSRDADGAAAVAESELARLDGSSATALLTDELSRKRSLISYEVDRYVPLIFAKHLLAEAVRRFDEANRPEMIKTVSRLLSQMTGGRYVEFDRTTDSSQTMLVRRSDKVERTPEQLSTGTREQLYLAIRLAYVLHYCRDNEPLPIVMDDVLVNFDDDRARQTLATLQGITDTVQVLFFTCHPHMVELAKEVVPGLKPVELRSTGTIRPRPAQTLF